MAIVTGDRYLDQLVKFVEKHAGSLIEGTMVLKLNPVGLHYVQTRLEQLQEVEGLLAGAPVDYLRAYISDLGDHRALEQLRRILRLLTSLKVVSIFPQPARDPTPLSLLPFSRLKVLEFRGCDLSTSAARGLLELRHTLEKLICYNSTDALRHVFASRIIDIKASPVWYKLTFVSCACNGIVPMDESLQLLPAVETLDLSRNRFAKVDNLRKCTKLTHLDLGFNHLRTIASLSEVSCPIVKLVLRNNALTTLRGIENLKSIEGLDLSYNIISTFSELELLSGLPSLKSLWLEGNPICCARWYRAHVFSFFAHPDTLKLDERVISKRESWKRRIILASRNKRPPGYGFYSPAKELGEDGNCNTKRKKHSRLACIEDDELRKHFSSDQVDHESASCDGENLKREDSIISEGEEEILGLINRVELMKKEQSVLWLREFREWMDQSSEVMMHNKSLHGGLAGPSGGRGIKMRRDAKCLGEHTRHASELVQDSGDETSTNPIDSETSFTDTFVSFHSQEFSSSGKRSGAGSSMIHDSHKVKSLETAYLEKPSSPRSSNLEEGDRTDLALNLTSLKAIDEIMVSRMPSLPPSSPPHYEEDILHRRQGLEEEFMQLSSESFSVVSSDSDTSCCDDNGSSNFSESYPKFYHLSDEDSLEGSVADQQDAFLDENYSDMGSEEQSGSVSCSHREKNSQPATRSLVIPMDQKTCDIMSLDDHFSKKRKKKQRPRMILLSEENTMKAKDSFLKLNGILHAGKVKEQVEFDPLGFDRNVIHSSQDMEKAPLKYFGSSTPEHEHFIKNYFDKEIAKHEASEICLHCMHCRCMYQRSGREDIEVCILCSSENKVYMLVLDEEGGGTGQVLTLLGCHRLQDITNVSVGIGLHILRVHIEDKQFLFIMRTVEEARELLLVLGVNDSLETDSGCSLTSWEQVQVNLFSEEICGGLRMGIYLYSMILFWHETSGGDWWLSRSLFVVDGYVVVCIEDVVQFSTIRDEAHVSSPYYTLDSCCPIHKISEMVVEIKGHRCVTLTMDQIVPEDIKIFTKEMQPQENAMGLLTWKLKWYSEDALLKFVALLRAIYAGVTMSPLPIRCLP